MSEHGDDETMDADRLTDEEVREILSAAGNTAEPPAEHTPPNPAPPAAEPPAAAEVNPLAGGEVNPPPAEQVSEAVEIELMRSFRDEMRVAIASPELGHRVAEAIERQKRVSLALEEHVAFKRALIAWAHDAAELLFRELIGAGFEALLSRRGEDRAREHLLVSFAQRLNERVQKHGPSIFGRGESLP